MARRSSERAPVIRAALDGTPLFGQRTGIGRYTENLLEALQGRHDAVTLSATAFTLRGWRQLADLVPAGTRTRSLPVPARGLRYLWGRAEFPPVQWLAGRFDVFHATNFVLPPTGAAAGVVTIHDLSFLTMPEAVDSVSRQLVDLVPQSLRRAQVVCTPTRAIADQVLDVYGDQVKQVQVTPLGVSPSWRSAPRPDLQRLLELGLPGDYFLFIGTREPRKDLRTLTYAYQIARQGRPDFPSLVLIGPSGWGSRAELPEGTVVRPYAEQDEIQQAVAGARALIMPSRYEGFGLPALEALATGTTVIVSADKALVEVTGGHALVFPIGDAEHLAQHLSDVATTESTDEERALRREWSKRWTWDRCATSTIEAYRCAVGW